MTPTPNGRLQSLLAEIESAAALMELARTSRDEPSTIDMCRAGVHRAYEAAMGLVLGTAMTDPQEHDVWNRLAPIRLWLEAQTIKAVPTRSPPIAV